MRSGRTRRGLSRRSSLVLAALLGAAGCGSLVAAATSAFASGPPDETFTATALAYGIDATLDNPSIPLGLTVEGVGPTAQAELDSLQQSTAFASFPYPGQTVAGLPGIAGALIGFPTPAYPLFVSSGYGQHPADANVPGVALHSAVTLMTSTGKATVGSDASGFTSTATSTEDGDGTVTATADTVYDGLQLAGELRLSALHSHVVAVRDPDGTLHTSSSTSIGQISVPGLSITLPMKTPGSLPLLNPIPGLPQPPPVNLPTLPLPSGGQTIASPDIGFEDGAFTITLPLPNGTKATFGLPADTALAALKAVGIDASYQAAHPRSNGIDAGQLTLSTTIPAPPSNPLASGATPVTYTLGRASATVDLHAVASSVGAPTGVTPTTGSTDSTAGSAGSTTGAVGTTGTTGAGAGSLGALPGGVTAPVGDVPGAAPPATVAQPGVQAQALVHHVPVRDAADIYLVLVGAAGVGAAAALLFRTLGVRSA